MVVSTRSFSDAAASTSTTIEEEASPMTTAKELDLADAVQLARTLSKRSFDESVDLALKLGVDPRRPNQMVRGVAQLPYAFKETKVAVFARGQKVCCVSCWV